MDEVKTKLVLEGEARGFDKVQDMVDQVTGAVEGSGAKPSLIAGLDKALSGIAQSLGKLDQVVERVTKSAKELHGVADKSDRSANKPPRTPRADPSFTRGILQGLGIGEYFPGQNRGRLALQAGGVLAGRTLRGAFGSAFTGVQGLAALGGPEAAAMGAAAAAAVQEALQLEHAEMGVAPMLNYRGADAAAGRARGRALKEKYEAIAEARLAARQEIAEMAGGRGVSALDPATSGLTQYEKAVISPTGRARLEAAQRRIAEGRATAKDYADVGRMIGAERTAVDHRARVADLERSGEANADRAASVARRRALFGDVMEGRHAYGLNRIQLLESLQGFLGARGGLLDDGAAGGFRSGLAAQARYGVGLSTSGILARGRRTGAFSDTSSEADQVASAIGRATALHLRGSEIGEHLARMAEGIQSFETTGIPLASDATDSIARALQVGDMSPAAAAARSHSFVSGIQARAQAGLPQSAVDFSALVHLGGYQGGGTEQALAALNRIAMGDFAPGGFQQLVQVGRQQLPTGPAGETHGVQMLFRRLGLSLNPAEAQRLAAGDPEELARAEQAARSLLTGEALQHEGRQVAGAGLRRQAEIEDIRLRAGQRARLAVQDFEARAAEGTVHFSSLIDKLRVLNPILDAVVNKFGQLVGSESYPEHGP